jgi:hypothetical protein
MGSGDSYSNVIEAFGGPAAYGGAIGIPDSHARAMKTRDSIPPAYWRRTAAAAAGRKSLAWITFEKLAAIAAAAAERQLAERAAS